MLTGIALALILSACAKGEGDWVTPAQSSQSGAEQAAATQGADATGNLQDALPQGGTLLDTEYNINVTALGMSMCQGGIHLKINATFSSQSTTQLFEVPEGTVHCSLFGDIDLKGLLGGFAQSQTQVQDPIVVEDNIIEIRQIGDGTYDPPRPMLPSFIAGDRSALQSLNVTKSVTINSTKEGKTATGSSTIHMLSFGVPGSTPQMKRTFKDTLDFEVVNTGFDNVDKVSNMLFDRMEFKISLNPIAILHVSFKGSAHDYMVAQKNNPGLATGGAGGILGGSGTSGGLMGGLVNLIVDGVSHLITVDLEMDLMAQQGLDPNAAADADDAGEVIGGKATQD